MPAWEQTMTRWIMSLAGLALAMSAHAAGAPYDEAADAKAAIRQALVQAAPKGLPVLVVFGANWCPDCKVLDMAMTEGPAAALVAREFRVVKVDVGRFDRNLDVAEAHGVPLKKGIPAVAVVAPNRDVVYVTRAGELADARRMGDTGILDFFRGVAERGRTKP